MKWDGDQKDFPKLDDGLLADVYNKLIESLNEWLPDKNSELVIVADEQIGVELIHISTHCMEFEGYRYLALSSSETDHVWLSGKEVELKLVVILSGCGTAIPGPQDGVTMGLAQSFLVAEAQAVVGTL